MAGGWFEVGFMQCLGAFYTVFMQEGRKITGPILKFCIFTVYFVNI